MRRSWRLNERHYGDLTGKDKKETAEQFGIDQVKLWRRSYDVPAAAAARRRPAQQRRATRATATCRAEFIPATECLKDVVARVTPYFADVIVEDLRREAVRGGAVIVVAHGNSLRALRKVLQNIPEDEIADLEIPTGIPYRIDARRRTQRRSRPTTSATPRPRPRPRAVARQAG